LDQDRIQALGAQLFGLIPGKPIPENEQRMVLATAGVILNDLTGHIQRAVREQGNGIAVILPDGRIAWYTPEGVVRELDTAVSAGDKAMVDAFRDMLALIERMDPEDHVLLAIVTDTALRVFKLPLDDQLGCLRRMLEHWGS
jgi:hypothetical protein